MLRGPEEVSIINVLMWVRAVYSAWGGWCGVTRLDWNKLTTSCVYIMDGNGRKRRTLSCRFIRPLHRFRLIDLLHTGLREKQLLWRWIRLATSCTHHISIALCTLISGADIANFIDSFLWCNEGAAEKLGHPLDSPTHQPEWSYIQKLIKSSKTACILPLVSH